MTRQEAIKKVTKLRRLARRTASAEEAATARLAVAAIMREHDLSEHDLNIISMSEAYDALLRELETTVSSRSAETGDVFGTAKLVENVVSKLRGASPEEKSSRLRVAATAIRTIAFVSGKNTLASSIEKRLDKILKDHEVAL